MSESSGAVTTGSGVVGVILEEPESTGASGSRQQAQAPERAGTLRCALWPRQQTWLCAVPLLIGFIGLGLSLMLLKWIVVGSVRDYMPTDLVDAKGIGQDPIFLSKPSAFPKGSDTTTTTTTTSGPVGSSSPSITTSVRGKTRSGTPPNPSHRGGGASGSQVTQKSTTQRSGTRGPTTTAFTTTSSGRTSTSSPSPSNPTVLNDSTQMWTREQPSTERPVTTPARTHISRKTPAPTLPPLKSEHFKPCQEKDLAYCLNDGECFVIETLSGPHKHCRCKEGFQGIRCDQFLPKTDSILSDPTDHLGIEFMESKEVYKRQVLSITCIAMGISFLGTLCMALYCRNKRRREKLQAHLKESRSLKNYSLSSSGLPCKSSLRPHSGLQLQNYCKSTRPSPPHGGSVHESSFAETAAASAHPRILSTGRHYRSGSLSFSGEQRNNRSALRLAARKTPPIPRGRLNPIGNSRDSGPAYQHLQETDGSEREMEPGRVSTMKSDGNLHQDSFHNMQASHSSRSWGGHLDQGSSRNLCSSIPGKCSPVPYRPCSIPIIPSVHSHQDEASCMQTATMNGSGERSTPQEKEAAHLLEEAQEQLRALAHANKKQEDGMFPVPQGARETVCILLTNGGGNGGVPPSGPTETQLVDPRDTHKDSQQPSQ